MLRTKLALLILLSCLSFSACEKDDICVDGDTPLLVVRFYDFENQTEFKAVPALRVVGVGSSFTVDTFTDRTSLDSIGLPLKVDDTATVFDLILNSADDDDDFVAPPTSEDAALTFTYTTQEEFKSRACGFVMNFENLAQTLATDTDNWIKQIEIDTSVVANSASAHVKIFH